MKVDSPRRGGSRMIRVAGLTILMCIGYFAGAGWGLGNASATDTESSPLMVKDLRCEFRTDPTGIDTPRPRLSWILEAGDSRGERQTACRVLVASTPELLAAGKGDLWDSGRMETDRSVGVEYSGLPLESRQRCFWKVRVWDGRGRETAWSQAALWTMGLLKPEDWSASWISTETGPVPIHNDPVTILKATYSAMDGSESKDVTEKIKALAKDGRLNLRVNSTLLGGDSAPQQTKELRVTYLAEGKQREAAAEDLQYLILPEPEITWPSLQDEPCLRRSFDLEEVPDSATAYVNVMGFYELYVNGKKVGEDVMSPALTNYSKRSLYCTYDLSPYLRKGRNCIALRLGRGWYLRSCNPAVNHDTAIARLQLEMSVKGKSVTLGTDGSWVWKSNGRQILGEWKWNQMGGELLDANREDPNWADPEKDDSDWLHARVVDAQAIPADAQRCPPTRILQTIPAVSVTEFVRSGKTKYEIDFGTNLTGWMKIRFHGLRAGQVVSIRYADRKEPFYQTYGQEDRFISSGKDGEEFCSKFNYHGFRYAVVEGLEKPPEPRDAEALFIGADWESCGTFECSDPLLNRMHEVNLRTLRCLSQGGYLSDCPHRERLGYGDGQVSVESCVMNWRMAPFYAKWSTDWCDGADEATGSLPHTAPQYKMGGGGPAWGGAAQAMTWRNYLHYGDRRIIGRNYDACRRHLEAIEAHATDGIVRAYGGKWDFIGDWVPPERGMDTHNWPSQRAAELFNNCYRLYLREQLAAMADILGRDEEAKACRAELDRLRPLVHAAFYDKEKQLYVIDEQSCQLMPLMTGVVPGELRETILKKLEHGILVNRKRHLDTGMLGTYFLLNYLSDIGRDDLIHTMVTQKTYPGWGYMLGQGATTWWEQWNGYWSRIHSCFTSLDGWFYGGLAGIRPDPASPGFKHVLIRPAIVGDLIWVKCSYDSVHGRIVSNWSLKEGKLTMEITVPPNTTATIRVPSSEPGQVEESGRPVSKAEGIRILKEEEEPGALLLEAGSGRYRFTSHYRKP